MRTESDGDLEDLHKVDGRRWYASSLHGLVDDDVLGEAERVEGGGGAVG